MKNSHSFSKHTLNTFIYAINVQVHNITSEIYYRVQKQLISLLSVLSYFCCCYWSLSSTTEHETRQQSCHSCCRIVRWMELRTCMPFFGRSLEWLFLLCLFRFSSFSSKPKHTYTHIATFALAHVLTHTHALVELANKASKWIKRAQFDWQYKHITHIYTDTLTRINQYSSIGCLVNPHDTHAIYAGPRPKGNWLNFCSHRFSTVSMFLVPCMYPKLWLRACLANAFSLTSNHLLASCSVVYVKEFLSLREMLFH